MSRTSRRVFRYVVIAGLVAAVLTACGGSSSPKSSGATTTSSGSSGQPTTTKTGPAVAATVDPSDPAYAKAALQLSDVGAGFANYRKPGGVSPFGAESCAVTAPGAFLTTKDHAYDGAMFKQKDATYFAYSQTYVFRTEADAKRFATLRGTAAYKQCKVKQDDEATKAARKGVYVKLTPVAWSDPTTHVPNMYRELTGNITNGKQVDNGFYDRYTVRRGRVVIQVSIDSDLGRDDAASQAIANQTGDILRAFDKALTTRLAGV
jgi:hypothetical protein